MLWQLHCTTNKDKIERFMIFGADDDHVTISRNYTKRHSEYNSLFISRGRNLLSLLSPRKQKVTHKGEHPNKTVVCKMFSVSNISNLRVCVELC